LARVRSRGGRGAAREEFFCTQEQQDKQVLGFEARQKGQLDGNVLMKVTKIENGHAAH
jgi:hypothetical protein